MVRPVNDHGNGIYRVALCLMHRLGKPQALGSLYLDVERMPGDGRGDIRVAAPALAPCQQPLLMTLGGDAAGGQHLQQLPLSRVAFSFAVRRNATSFRFFAA